MSNEWDAFISYSRQATRAEAEALQARIQTFAKPWNRLRSARVFRDDASMSANAGLWPTIERALIEARYFILILSPAAAASEWVDNEVRWWLDHKGQDTILLVHASGTVAWDKDVGFSAASDCVPPALRAGLTVEPRWVDLTWFSQPASTGAADPRFQEIVADLAAPIRGIERDELVGEHVSQLRRTRRLSRIAITALSVLLALALVLAGVAYAQMRVAQEQTRLATVRLLTSESQRLATSNVGLSRLLAAQANSMSDDVETRRALFGSLTAGPHLVAELAIESPRAVAVNPDGSIVAIVDSSGVLKRWEVPSGRIEELGASCPRHIRRMAMSDDGRVIVGNCGNGGAFAYIGADPMELTGERVVAVSPSGKTVAHLIGDALHLTKISGTDINTTRAGTLRWSGNLIGLSSDETLVAIDEFNATGALVDLHSLRTVYVMNFSPSATVYKRVLSRTGEAYWDSSSVWHTYDGATHPYSISPHGGYYDFVAMAISDSGETAAYAAGTGGIEVTSPAASNTAVKVRAHLEAGSIVGQIAIGGSDIIVASHDGVVSLWDLRRPSSAHFSNRLQTPTMKEFPIALPNDDDTFAPNQTGTATALAFGDGSSLSVFNQQGGMQFEDRSSNGRPTFIGWRSDSRFLYISNGEIREHDIDSGQQVRAHKIPNMSLAGVAVNWDTKANRVILSNSDGAAYSVDPDNGNTEPISAISASIPEPKPSEDGSAFVHQPVSPDGSTGLTTTVRGNALLIDRITSREWGRVPLTLFEDDVTGEWAYGAFSGDGKRALLLSQGASHEPILTVVEVDPDRMVEAACHTVRRSLTLGEWEHTTGLAPPADLACQDWAPSSAPPASASAQASRPSSESEQAPPSPRVSGWVTVLDSKPKAESGSHAAAADMAAAMTASSGAKVEVLDTDAYPALTPGYWAVVLTGSTTEAEARTACARVSREPGPACYPRSLG